VKPMEAQRQEAVRIGPFTVLAFVDEQAQQHTLKRLLMGGYQAQFTAHFAICRKAHGMRNELYFLLKPLR